MSTTVIARNRHRMYTAFVTHDHRCILNIADIVDGRQQCVSIEIGEDDVAGVVSEDAAVIERLLHSGTRLSTALPTPPAGQPVIAQGHHKAA